MPPSITYNTNTHSASFSGSNQGFSCPASTHNAISNGWTIEFMFKQTNEQQPVGGHTQFILGRENVLMRVSNSGGSSALTIFRITSPSFVMGSSDYSDGQWHRISVIIGSVGSPSSIYKDGVLSVSAGNTPSFTASVGDFIVGLSSTFDDYNGLLDDIRLWSVQRTPTEISTYKTTELQGNEAGLEMYLKLNNGLTDATGNHTFTNSGATFTTDYGFQNNVTRPIVRSVATVVLD